MYVELHQKKMYVESFFSSFFLGGGGGDIACLLSLIFSS